MNWDAIGAVSEMFAALGVVASLLYLAIQIRRSDQTARAESLQALWNGARDRSFAASYTDPEVADLLASGLSDFDSLDSSEKRRFFWLFAEHCFQAQQAMDLHNSKLISDTDYHAWIYYTATLMQTPGGKLIWGYLSNTLTPNIQNVMNEFIAAHPDTPSFIDLNPFFKKD
jgi:hypothetical protein